MCCGCGGFERVKFVQQTIIRPIVLTTAAVPMVNLNDVT